MIVRLSARQHPMLKMFATGGKGYMMTEEGARQFDQRPFRSMLVHKWIEYVPDKGFRITEKGREAWMEFETTSILRKSFLGPLTSYFDPLAPEWRRRSNLRHFKGRAA